MSVFRATITGQEIMACESMGHVKAMIAYKKAALLSDAGWLTQPASEWPEVLTENNFDVDAINLAVKGYEEPNHD